MRPLAIVEKGGVQVITLDDITALNEGHAAGLRQQLYTMLNARESPRLAIDLAAIDYVSSSGIAFLIGTKRRVEAALGRLVLFGVHPDVQELFGAMKLVDLFEIATDEADALQLFSSPPPV